MNKIVLVLSFFLLVHNISAQLKTPYKFNQKPITVQEISKTSVFIEALGKQLAGNVDDAIALYERALELNPDNADAYYQLSKLYISKYKTDEAVNSARKAASLDDKNVYYLLNYAKFIATTPPNKEELAIYAKVISLEPDNLEAQFNYTNALLMTKDYKLSLAQLQKLENIIGINEEISLKAITIYDLQHKEKKAIEEMQKLCNAFPDETRYLSMLGDLFMKYGKEEEAFNCYKKISEIKPDNPQLHLQLFNYYLKKNSIDKAYDELQICFASKLLDARSKIQILLQYYSYEEIYKTNNQRVINLLKTISETHPEDPVSIAMLSDFDLQDNRFGEAKKGYYKAMELGFNNSSIFLNLIFIELQLNNIDSAIALSSKAVSLFPLIPEFYYYKGTSEYMAKNYNDAIDVLKVGIIMVVDNYKLKADMLMLQGDCYYVINNKTEAYDNYDKSLSLNYDNPILLNNYSYYLSTSDTAINKALEMAKRAVELQPANSYYLDTYAWALFKNEQYADAELYLLKALSLCKDDRVTILEHLGDVKWKLGYKNAAVDYWEKAQQADYPNANEELKRKILNKSY